jgi:lipoprotein NlpI
MAAQFFFVAPILTGSALADDADTCSKGSGNEKIAACTAAINSGKWKGRNLAWAYSNRACGYNEIAEYIRAIADATEAIRLNPEDAYGYVCRGWAYDDTDQFDRAIADETKAIELKPTFAAFNNRGSAHVDKLEFDEAIIDFSRAIQINPKYDSAYRNRARAYLYTGRLAEALADINQATEIDPKKMYGALWLDIISQRNKVSSRLSQLSAQFDMTVWPAPIVRMFLGQMTSAAVVAAADNVNPRIKTDRLCEANFYSGEMALRTGAKNEALRLFKIAARDCPHGKDEWHPAKAEVRALGAAP